MSGSIIYTLQHPVELKGKDGAVLDTVRQLELKRLNGGAARRVLNAHAKGAGEFAFELICASAGIPPSTFDKLDAEDILIATEMAAPFLRSGPPT